LHACISCLSDGLEVHLGLLPWYSEGLTFINLLQDSE